MFEREGFSEQIVDGNVGIHKLRTKKLPGLLEERIKKSLPQLRDHIYDKQKQAEKDLNLVDVMYVKNMFLTS